MNPKIVFFVNIKDEQIATKQFKAKNYY